MFAIIETGGKQYRVAEGVELFIEKLNVEAESEVVFDKVLMVNEKIGTPYVEGATVTAKVEKHGLSRKIRVFKYKAKHNERKTIGHRQPYTCLTIEAINA